MWDRLKMAWGTGGRDYSPEFKPSGLALDHIQFSYRNITGEGATSKPRAVLNWLREFTNFVRGL